eukprot:scaffold26633_cov140-Isochrysis_galbana.AAC.2
MCQSRCFTPCHIRAEAAARSWTAARPQQSQPPPTHKKLSSLAMVGAARTWWCTQLWMIATLIIVLHFNARLSKNKRAASTGVGSKHQNGGCVADGGISKLGGYIVHRG